VVPGDLVNLTAGDKIPADLRIVESLGLKVDNSSLTGETEPQARGTSLRLSAGHSVLDAENIVFSGSLVCEGSAFGVAVRTGDRAIIGRIAALTTGGVGEEAGGRGRGARRASPLHEEIRSFVYLTGIIATSVASIFFAVGMAISPNFLTNFVFFIGVFVAFVPQGLPATVSMLLSFAAKEMAEEGVVVKDLHGVDTLGTINVLVCDKTGTMTQNKMTVVYTWLGDQDADPDFFLAGCGLCSRASFQATEENLALPPSKRVVMGDATESGILRYVAETVNVAELRENHKVLATVPFSSRLKWSAAVNKGPFKFSSAPACVFLKGAPERILERCSARLVGPQCQCVGIDDYFRHAMMNEWAIQAAMGRRTLAFAGLPLWDPPGTKYSQEPEPNFPLSSLIFLGLVGIEDPPKNGVAPAVRTCRDAGIRVAILTGDHPATALAIARQVGVVTGLTREEAAAEADDIQSVKPSQYSAEVVACGDLGTLSPADWDRILNKEEIVFARATPEDKLHITMRFQAKGNVVGVTGDGINDAPALKRADLGIAMGISGSEVSKEAADMVIMDDNFTSIVKGIERGRKVFTNLKRSIQYTLSHITPEVVPFLLYIAIGIPLPLNSFLVLMIDLVTELGPALSLAWEAADRGDMLKPPRKHAEAGDGLVILSHEVPAIVATLSNDGVPVSMQEVDLLEQRNASLIPRGMWRVGRGRRSCGSHVPANYHQKDEVLVDSTLLRWSYGFTGLLHTVAALSSYAMVFSNHGLGLSDLLGTARSHFGREFTSSVEIGSTVLSSEEQSKILREAQAAYFQTLVIGQCFANFVLKHRENHNGWKCFVAQPSLQQNPRTSIACAISVGLSFFLVFTPGLNTILSALPPLPLSPEIYLIAACEGLALMLLESLRRWLHGYLR
jgi:sodium/potassium-transporting ATPase subunit alpha